MVLGFTQISQRNKSVQPHAAPGVMVNNRAGLRAFIGSCGGGRWAYRWGRLHFWFKIETGRLPWLYCSVFEYWDTQFGLLVGFISIFTSRNYTQLLHFQDCCDYNTQSLQFTSLIGLLTLVPLFTCSERLVFTWKLPTTSCLSLSLLLRPMVSRAVCLGIKHPSGVCDQIFFSFRNTEYVWQLRSWFRGTPSLTRGRVCLLYVPLALASAVFFGPSPLGLATVFYCLRFETSLFVASYDSQGHGGVIRPRLHMGALIAWVAPVVFKTRHGPQRKHIFPYCFVSAVTCLSSRCLGMDRITPLFYCCVT
jgi:hypothetical protein